MAPVPGLSKGALLPRGYDERVTPVEPRPDDDDVARIELPRREGQAPGAKPGIEPHELASMPSEAGQALVTCIDYATDEYGHEDVTDVPAFLARHRPDWSAVRWINVAGIGDLGVVEALARKYHLHPLAIEDVLHVGQRPKLDSYGETGEYQARLFVVTRILTLVEGTLRAEQISIFLGHRTVLTFLEDPGDVWDPIRQRLATKGARLRQQDASFLVYSLLDAVVDHVFPILERYGDRLEELEEILLEKPDREAVQEVHRIKRDLLTIRHAVWPMREVIAGLMRETHECLSDATRLYLRDLNDHVTQIIEVVEAYREIVRGLAETYMTSLSVRTNEVMKVLTIVGTVFIPLTFLAGVYGMNFQHMPEIPMRWAYPAFWVVCVLVAIGMVVWFRRRDWL